MYFSSSTSSLKYHGAMVEEDTLITETVYVEYDYYIIKGHRSKYVFTSSYSFFLTLLRGSMVAFFCYCFLFHTLWLQWVILFYFKAQNKDFYIYIHIYIHIQAVEHVNSNSF